VWFTALLPRAVDQDEVADAVGYARTIGGVGYEFVHSGVGAIGYRDGAEFARFPSGWRLVLDRLGAVRAVVGLSATPITGALTVGGVSTQLTLGGNDRVALDDHGRVAGRVAIGLIAPTS